MHPRWPRMVIPLLLLAAPVHAAEKREKARLEPGDDHLREELGINKFTTPSIEIVLRALRDLRPFSYESVARDLPAKLPSDRARLALSTGGVIADGFLAVIAEKQSRIEGIGRSLLQHAKGLGVGDHVTRHSRSILEKAATKDWDGVRGELIGTQRDVEKGMMALKDEEIAHLVALGGWWRGLEISAGVIGEEYTPKRAALLVQPSLLDYFADRVGTLNPNIKKQPVFTALETALAEVRKVAVKADRTPPTADEVRKIREIARGMNSAILKAEQ